jgi:hypothetical protein
MAYTFIRWARAGMAAALGDQPQSTGSARRATLTVGVEVTGTGLTSRQASADLAVLGPGDVSGIDARQVIRMFPVPGTLDFEPSYHAHVEFDRLDLPWLFTPFGPTSGESLRPWICLVVVEKGEHAEVTPGPTLPLLTVSGAEVVNLPNLDDSHRFAHVQISGDNAAGARAISENEPERILSRLMCPRELSERTTYLACVVPTFAIGALAGLGRPVPANPPLEAWSPDDATVELPVYHHWEFTTATGGDFRSLVLRLEPQEQLRGVGTRPLDVSRPAFGLAARPGAAAVPLGGILRADIPAEAPIDKALADDLDPSVNDISRVQPPIYGRWHAAATSVSIPPTGWLDQLNLDPRHRVAAGLGTQVVQELQEDLMAAVWEQLGEILRANQLLRQAQLAIASSKRVVTRHLSALNDAALLAVTGPASARILVAPGRTVRGAVAGSCLPVLGLSGAFRRILRSRGPIQRRLASVDLTDVPDGDAPPSPRPAVDPSDVLRDLAAGALTVTPPRIPHGAVPLPKEVAPMPPVHLPHRGPLDPRARPGGPLAELTRTFTLLARRGTTVPCAPLDLAATAGAIRAAIDPDVSVAGRARAQVSVPKSTRMAISNRLDPIMASPEIPTPMMGPLQELGAEWLLPGIDAVPANSVTIVEPNREFIEAYLVGLNHEMGRELLWRGFPTDQRGTVFSRFWDRRGAVPTTTTPVADRDIPDIHRWDAEEALGDHLDTGGGKGPVVLLVRGDLLRRYPRPTIYVQRARWIRDGGVEIVVNDDGLAGREPEPLDSAAAWEANVLFPQFGGRSGADIAFFGFPIARATIRGLDRRDLPSRSRDDEAGWYVVFQEQPTEPRFGPLAAPAVAQQSDELAAELLRPAFRLFVHASDLVVG